MLYIPMTQDIMRNRTAIFWGLPLILVGAGWLVNNFQPLAPGWWSWWPLIITGGGIWIATAALRCRDGQGMVTGWVTLGSGLFWLLRNYGQADDRFFLPILTLALGLGLLGRYFRQGIT